MNEKIVNFLLQNWFQVLMVLAAVYFGLRQTSINKRLKDLQDIIAISLVVEYQKPPEQLTPFQPPIPFFKFLNVGKLNIYIYELQILETSTNGEIVKKIIDEKYNQPRLIPAGGSDPSSYRYPILRDIKAGNFKIILKITDEFNKKYISEHAGDFDGKIIRVWSYKTYKNKWSVQ